MAGFVLLNSQLLVGRGITLLYAIHRREAVIIMGHLLAVVTYVRNIMLILRARGKASEAN